MSQSKHYRLQVSINSGGMNIMMLAYPNIKLAEICLSWCHTLMYWKIFATLDTDSWDLNEGKQRLQRLLVENSGHSSLEECQHVVGRREGEKTNMGWQSTFINSIACQTATASLRHLAHWAAVPIMVNGMLMQIPDWSVVWAHMIPELSSGLEFPDSMTLRLSVRFELWETLTLLYCLHQFSFSRIFV